MKEIHFNHLMQTSYSHIKNTGRIIRHICVKFKSFFISRLAKEDIFKTKWNRLRYRISSLSKVKNDKVMKAFAKEIFKIPTEVV